MSDSGDTAVLAIDGGGTRCRLAFVVGAERHVAEGGPANTFSDFDGAICCIVDGLEALAALSGRSVEVLAKLPAFVGLAGVSGSAVEARLTAALPLTNALYADDRRSAVRGALGSETGFLAHCGTGSFLARQDKDEVQLVGGWGAALGDEASAQWVGRTALKHALLSYDGLSAGSPLTETLLAEFEGPNGILSFVSSATPEAYGALAPRVTEFVSKADVTAIEILVGGAAYLESTLIKMGWRDGQPICLTGGIGPQYRPFLPEDMRRVLQEPKGSPLDGGIELARAHARENSDGHC